LQIVAIIGGAFAPPLAKKEGDFMQTKLGFPLLFVLPGDSYSESYTYDTGGRQFAEHDYRRRADSVLYL